MNVEFYRGTQSQYNSVKANNHIDEGGVYFISDTHRIYFGNVVMSEIYPDGDAQMYPDGDPPYFVNGDKRQYGSDE